MLLTPDSHPILQPANNMDRELLGYLLNALDDASRAQVEAQLTQDPSSRDRLALLERALEPLAADAEPPPPPPGLFAKTIALAAEHMARPLPQAPVPRFDSPVISTFSRRRVDVLLAACLLIAVVGMTAPMLWRSHVEKARTAHCQENLRNLYVALESYHHIHGSYPDVASEKPRHAAGMVLPILRDRGNLDPARPVLCPGMREPAPNDLPLEQLRAMDLETFLQYAPELNPSYGYSLGFVNETGGYQAPRRAQNGLRGLMPLMADAPLCDGGPGNSPNHGGRGQNVLFQDGHVKFLNTRLAGFDRDDIYLNKDRKVGAGRDPLDAVLGCSAAKP